MAGIHQLMAGTPIFARAVFALSVGAIGLGSVGCGSGSRAETSSACVSGADTYRSALASAPGEVRLAEGTSISDCLPNEQGTGQFTEVGRLLIAVATDLNAEARANPASPETTQLGYLVGAVDLAAEDSGGAFADLVRRLNTAARFSPQGKLLPAAFERAFGEGYAAGRASG